jgi:hypothetical protein
VTYSQSTVSRSRPRRIAALEDGAEDGVAEADADVPARISEEAVERATRRRLKPEEPGSL